MTLLVESIHNLAANASFEPIDPLECKKTRVIDGVLDYYWPVDESELNRLRTIFDAPSVKASGTWVSRPRTNCPHCGKREEFIDQIYTAAKQGAHPPDFMRAVVLGDIPAIGTGADHNMHCSNCDTELEKYGWKDFPWYHQTL
ncbi:hypothetical protein BGZ68_000423 [Mortierella alpina]|nr:hypothetical protein BGZ68_000423 [Mortierella alpina]